MSKRIIGKTPAAGMSRDEKIATLKKNASVEYDKLARGRWKTECRGAVSVADPEKMSWHCNRNGLAVPVRNDRGIITAKEIDDLEFAFAEGLGDRSFREEFDAMLFGGGKRWADEWSNLVLNGGLDHLLDVVLSGGTQDTSWFVGLLGASPTPAATDTATQIATYDFVNYDESTLPAFTDGGVSGQSVSNSASTADFTCSTNSSTVGGAFLIGTNAKATPSGVVYAAGAFSGGNKSLDDGDTLSVTSTFTAAAA